MKKYAIHFGLDYLSYKIDGEVIQAKSAVANMNYYHNLALKNNLISETYENEKATSENFILKLKELARIMQNGDFLFISYSGHGTEIIADRNQGSKDQIMVLYDRFFLDKEFLNCVRRFKKDVSIFIVTNSCRNASIIDTDVMFSGRYIENLKIIKKRVEENNEEQPEPDENITIMQYYSYLKSIRHYLRKHPKPKNPIIHIASSKDGKDSNDSNQRGHKSEFTIAFESIISKNKNITYRELFNNLKISKLKSIPSLRCNERCSIINLFLDAEIFSTINKKYQ